ncbi:DUF4326 domain-containing protein [Paenarthrobacter sp. YJN-5]|nr:DUF4326 domain-containing protein [Paenarthrobacter sp. YJN-5]QOT15911.1 DUF4326 domain-containing protein [Paenarthrobacter sp. YJN-5]
MSPQRIQRKRTKGWRMPENTVYVGRGSKWGNPFAVGSDFIISERFGYGTAQLLTLSSLHPDDAVTLYGLWIANHHRADGPHPHRGMARDELAGKNLACWCPLDQPCHADVLLELANR